MCSFIPYLDSKKLHGFFMQKWSPTSWLQYSYLQAATYADNEQLNKIVEQLSLLPPLVTSSEVKI